MLFQAPSFHLNEPNMTASTISMLETYGSGLIVVPLISFMEAMAIGKAFSRVNNYKIIPTQELVALGVANILSSFVSAYPVTGSFSRTAVNCQSGVKTPLAGMEKALSSLLIDKVKISTVPISEHHMFLDVCSVNQ